MSTAGRNRYQVEVEVFNSNALRDYTAHIVASTASEAERVREALRVGGVDPGKNGLRLVEVQL
jgi:hypothetical protein